MAGPPSLLRAKFSPPQPYRRTLVRPRVLARLARVVEHRLTIVQAGAGYGKTTALASLWRELGQLIGAGDGPDGAARPALMSPPFRRFWLTLDTADREPRQFLAYLAAAVGDLAPELGGEWDAPSPPQWLAQADRLINALSAADLNDAILILDDFHLVADEPDVVAVTERLLTYLPHDLHVVLATRQPVAFTALPAWRARGEVLEIEARDLAFTLEEVMALFEENDGAALSAGDAARLTELTEGWPIALQLSWQSLHARGRRSERGGGAVGVRQLLERETPPSDVLFDYLAHELLDRQSPEVRSFLLDTAVLRELTPGACAAVRGEPTSPDLLQHVHELDLFTVSLGDGHYRYHHLFHDFLRVHASSDGAGLRARHARAGAYYEARGEAETAVYHWLHAEQFDCAGRAIEAAAGAALGAGRLDTVSGWIDALPAPQVAKHPQLQALLGDICRLQSHFDRALAWYGESERLFRARGDLSGVSRALHGQASVYLDTVRPAEAEGLLQEALRLSEGIADRQQRARLLDLVAENKLNIGKPDEAEALRGEAQKLREEGPTEDTLSARVKLRTGQLAQARAMLEGRVEAERRAAQGGRMGPPRAHRETVLLLSLIAAFQGRADAALDLATEGIDLGERLNSPFVSAVGQMRLGHAQQLKAHLAATTPPPEQERQAGTSSPSEAGRDAALHGYRAAIALGDALDVRRTRAEAMWGLTRAYGFFGFADAAGDIKAAEAAAREGLEIARWAGDLWVGALTEMTLGASYVLAEQPQEGLGAIGRAAVAFRDCGDTFGRAATRLWEALAHASLKHSEAASGALHEALALCAVNGYDFLFTVPTLLGPPDPRRLIPLLLRLRGQREHGAYVGRLLALLGTPGVQAHPGYRLHVQTLGAFRAWRGETEVGPREWQRDKARQLFQLFLTERGRWLQREEVVERLWPSLGPEAGLRDFKVALNALNRAVEPGHATDEPFAFVAREGASYRLRPDADLWLDVAEFEDHCAAGLRGPLHGPEGERTLQQLRDAVRLYRGDYLPDALYEDWATEARERMLTLYLRAADRLAGALLDRGRYEEALNACQVILARDPCWERAYRLMMQAYRAQGNRPQALRAYQRCVDVLRQQLDVEPSPETVTLGNALAAG